MDILAYRADLAPNFVEKGSLILLSIKIMYGIILIQLRPLNTSVKKGKFQLCPPFLGIIFLGGRIHFVNTITVNSAAASGLCCFLSFHSAPQFFSVSYAIYMFVNMLFYNLWLALMPAMGQE